MNRDIKGFIVSSYASGEKIVILMTTLNAIVIEARDAKTRRQFCLRRAQVKHSALAA